MQNFRVSESQLTEIFQLDRRWVRTMCGVMLVQFKHWALEIEGWFLPSNLRPSRRPGMNITNATKPQPSSDQAQTNQNLMPPPFQVRAELCHGCQFCQFLPIWLKCNAVTVHRQPRHGQYHWERINIRELDVYLRTHLVFLGIDTKYQGMYI